MTYFNVGKQVLTGVNTHVADARDEATAADIARALNYYSDNVDRDAPAVRLEAPEEWPLDLPSAYDHEPIDAGPSLARHSVRQEGDEYACSCGARWGTDEGEDHP